MRKKILLFVLTFFLLLPYCKKAIPGKTFDNLPLISDSPFQELIYEDQTFILKNRSGTFKIIPLAKYSITAKVVSTENYYSGWSASLSPVDLALVWGKLAENKYKKGIKFSQRGRWYYFHYEAGYPIDKNYIIKHSSNNHIVPADLNIRLALKEIKKGDIVEISGMLIRIDGTTKKGNVFWKSSLGRDDSGGGSCELIYAETIRINKKLFR